MCLSHYWLVKADDGVVAEVQGVQLQPRQRRAQVASTQRKQLLNKHTHIYINHGDFDRAVHALSDTSWQMRCRRRVPPGSWGSSNMWRPPAESKPLADPPDSVEGFASAGEEETKRCLVSETEEEGGLRYFSMWCKVLIYRVDPKNQLRSYWNCEKGKVFILPPNISTTWMGRFSPQTEVSSLEGWWAAFKSKATRHIINKIHQK